MQKLSLVLVIALTVFSCNSPASEKEKPEFIDVTAYLKGQIAYIDTVPFAFEKTIFRDSVYTDTSFLTKEQLKSIVLAFLTEELEKNNFQKLYTESSFADASTNFITLTYEPEEKKDLPVQRVDVYVSPETQEIEKLFIVRKNENKDSSLTQQLLWKHNKSCKLITTVYKPNGAEQVISEKINWNDKEE